MSKLQRWTLIVVVASMLVAAFIANKTRQHATSTLMPDPNGYDTLVEAASNVSNTDTDYARLNREDLQKLVNAKAETIRLVRSGLSRECRVRTTNSMIFIQQHLDQVTNLKRLAHMFMAEGRLAEQEERFADAAKSYLDAIRFGQAITRGGLMIDGLVGIACEALGQKGLSTIRGELSARDIHEILAALQTIDETSEPAQATLRNEQQWSYRSAPLRSTILRIFQPGARKSTQLKFTQKRQLVDLQRRRLMLGLASSGFREEKGMDPKSYPDIVPSFLKVIPKDPRTQLPLSMQ